MPKRIQRKRSKGWRMPKDVVYVGRPTVFGNPYAEFPEVSLEMFRNSALGIWSFPETLSNWELEQLYPIHEEWTARIGGVARLHPLDVIRSLLWGKDLACWCQLSDQCHADILLELANK